MPDLSAQGGTRQRYLPFTPPTGQYIGFLRSVERLTGDRNRSKFAQDVRSAAAWRHQFKFIITHDAQGNPLPHIGSASFAEFLTTTKADSNIVRLKAAVNNTTPEAAAKLSLPHSNNLIALPFAISFERKMGVNGQQTPFVATDIASIQPLSQEWVNYLYQWLNQNGVEKKVLNGTDDAYLASPRSARACDLTDQELYQFGYTDQFVLSAIQFQRQAAMRQNNMQHNGFGNGAPAGPPAGAPGGYNNAAPHGNGGYAGPPAGNGGYAAPPPHANGVHAAGAPNGNGGYAAPQHGNGGYANPPNGNGGYTQAPPAQTSPAAYAAAPGGPPPTAYNATPPAPGGSYASPPAAHMNGMHAGPGATAVAPPPPAHATHGTLPPGPFVPPAPGPNGGGAPNGHALPPQVPPPAGMTFPEEVQPLRSGDDSMELSNEIPF